MDHTKYVSCYTCKNKTLIVVGKDGSFWECRETGFLFGEEELKRSRQCVYYEPDILTSLSDKEATLYNFLLDIGGPLVIESIPPSYRGALGKLKKLDLIRIYNAFVKVNLKDGFAKHIVLKKTKMVEVIGKEV